VGIIVSLTALGVGVFLGIYDGFGVLGKVVCIIIGMGVNNFFRGLVGYGVASDISGVGFGVGRLLGFGVGLLVGLLVDEEVFLTFAVGVGEVFFAFAEGVGEESAERL